MAQAGQLTIDAVDVNPNTVLPNGTVTVIVSIRETAAFVGPGDPDLCAPGQIGSGLNAEVTVTPDWTNPDIKTTCVPVWLLSNGVSELQWQFQAPGDTEETQHTVTVELRTTASQKGPEVVDRSVTVTGTGGGGSAGCTSDNDCPSGTVCVGGECVPEGSGGGGIGGGGGGPIDQIGDLGQWVVIGIGGLVALKGMDMLDQPEDGESDPQAEQVEPKGVPLPLDQRPEDDDETEG